MRNVEKKVLTEEDERYKKGKKMSMPTEAQYPEKKREKKTFLGFDNLEADDHLQ